MAKKSASEAGPKPKQDPDSETDPEGKAQDPSGSENGGGSEQEPKTMTLEEAKEALLKDPDFVNAVVTSEPVRKALQSERDVWGNEQTLPLKRQVEDLEAKLTEITKATDPDAREYEKLKEEGDYAGALALLEKRQAVAQVELGAVQRGKREGSQEILAAIARNEVFSDLTQEDWQKVTANATAEATSMGRSYLTTDQYIAHAVRLVKEKEREKVGAEGDKDVADQIKEGIDAELKKRGIEARKEDGDGEEPAGGAGAGGTYTSEQIGKMSREELAKVPKKERDKAMAGSGGKE